MPTHCRLPRRAEKPCARRPSPNIPTKSPPPENRPNPLCRAPFLPERRKNIRRLYIGATDTADGYIRLAYITEQGTREDALRLGDYGSGEMRQWMVTPGVNRVRQFGLKAESNGYMAVDNLVIKYEVNGEVR